MILYAVSFVLPSRYHRHFFWPDPIKEFQAQGGRCADSSFLCLGRCRGEGEITNRGYIQEYSKGLVKVSDRLRKNMTV